MAIDVAAAVEAELPELADVAARTFPLACPPSVTPENIAAFIDENLSQARFADYLADPDRAVLVARDDGRMVGYAMLIRGVPDDDDVQRAVTAAPRRRVVQDVRAARQPRRRRLRGADDRGAAAAPPISDAKCVWLGVNQQNQRAQRFYTKHGFTINGTKTFRLGAGIENDYVMVRPL